VQVQALFLAANIIKARAPILKPVICEGERTYRLL